MATEIKPHNYDLEYHFTSAAEGDPLKGTVTARFVPAGTEHEWSEPHGPWDIQGSWAKDMWLLKETGGTRSSVHLKPKDFDSKYPVGTEVGWAKKGPLTEAELPSWNLV